MEHIVLNELNINKNEIKKEVIRVKVLLVNSKNELLLCYYKNCYEFVGGHVRKNESINTALKREMSEELGVDIDTSSLEPFLLIEHYCLDSPKTDKYRNCKIYYFVIKKDIKQNINNTHYTKFEKDNNFELKSISISNFEDIIINNYKKYEEAEVIGIEMLKAFDQYRRL